MLRIECYTHQEIAQSAHLFNEAFLYYRPFSPQTSVGQMRWLMRNSWVDPDLLLCAKINETIESGRHGFTSVPDFVKEVARKYLRELGYLE